MLLPFMGCSFSLEDIASLGPLKAGPAGRLRWPSVFVLPGWLKAWWQVFGAGSSLFLGLVKRDDAVIGVAPLKVVGDTASFIGDASICDYLDFVISPGRETEFFSILLDEMKKRGISHLELGALRPDATVLGHLVGLAEGRQYSVSCRAVAASLELDLPATWPEYLAALTTKQRHEVKRRLRRLEEAGKVGFRVLRRQPEVLGGLDTFIRLLRQSRQDKARFMDEPMKTFFELVAGAMAEAGLLRLGFLELDKTPVAAVMYFDYNDTIYLYNSGYDPRYGGLSVGLLSKVLCIKDSIEQGKGRFDFLKGAEAYKYRLGGHKIPLHLCRIDL